MKRMIAGMLLSGCAYSQAVHDVERIEQLRAAQKYVSYHEYKKINDEIYAIKKAHNATHYFSPTRDYVAIMAVVPRVLWHIVFIGLAFLLCFFWQRISFFARATLLALFILLGFYIVWDYYDLHYLRYVCAPDQMVVRYGPDECYPIRGAISPFDEMCMYEKKGDWLLVKTPTMYGWILPMEQREAT
ncbi:MAG: hypothetical protein WC707_01295 [Candidatus Babeliaceae bacterium]|jgi:hypothetical protein